MPEATREERVLVLAPTGADATLTRSIIAMSGMTCHVCADLGQMAAEFSCGGAGALLLTDDLLMVREAALLVDALRKQPPWSDVPMILLSGAGADSMVAVGAMEALGNVTVLERPVRVTTLVSALRTAIRARRRQYELRERLAELERAEEKFRVALKNSPLVVGIQDRELRYTWIHNVHPGFWPPDVLGRRDDEILPPEQAESLIRVKRRALDTGQGERTEHQLAFHGRRHVFDVTVEPLRGSRGRITGVTVAAMDITDRKLAEEELRQADRRKDEFLATLAHELRNPLAPLSTGLQILRRAGDRAAQAGEAITMMERQLGQLARLVEDLLDVSRITRGLLELRSEPVTVQSVVASAVESSRPLIDEKSHSLTFDLPTEPIRVEADMTRLAQVVSNLLNNAARYTGRGGNIHIAAERVGREVALRVSDNGMGIPPEMLPRIFDMFTQVDRSLERTQSGLGVGLTLVRRIVELHGGRVEARSEGPGRGSEFIVHLPLMEPATRVQVPDRREERPVPAAARRVLVADDNADAAKSLAILLDLLGNEVRTARDGLEAVETAEAFRPDVILLDIGMPNLNGYDACRRIRRQPWAGDVLIVALTGRGQPDDRTRSEEAGFDHHLVKPIEAEALEQLLAADIPAGRRAR